MLPPPSAHRRVFMDVTQLPDDPEDPEAGGSSLPEDRGFLGLGRVPTVEEPAHCREGLGSDVWRGFGVALPERVEGLPGPLRLTVVLPEPEHVPAVVPEEAWVQPGAGRLGRAHHQQLLRTETTIHLLPRILELMEGPIRIQHHAERDLLKAVTRRCDLILWLTGEPVVEVIQRLE